MTLLESDKQTVSCRPIKINQEGDQVISKAMGLVPLCQSIDLYTWYPNVSSHWHRSERELRCVAATFRCKAATALLQVVLVKLSLQICGIELHLSKVANVISNQIVTNFPGPQVYLEFFLVGAYNFHLRFFIHPQMRIMQIYDAFSSERAIIRKQHHVQKL